jgi:2'-5' RNA ligase
MTRAFVAVRPPDAVLDAIAVRTSGVAFAERARLTTREQWHVTVQFLGDDVDVDAVAGALADVRAEPCVLQLSGAGTLPPERRSKYLVLYLREGAAWLTAVADQVAARVASLGIVRDRDTFVPHLTLARFRKPVRLRDECAAIGPEPVGPAWTCDELVLYESRLGHGPAQHIPRAAIRLAG